MTNEEKREWLKLTQLMYDEDYARPCDHLDGIYQLVKGELEAEDS